MKNQFGGSLLCKKRKSARPLAFDKTMHLVLRLNERLPAFFNPKDFQLRTLILTTAEKYEIKTYRLILNHTHLHMVIKLRDRISYIHFIKELTAKLTQNFSNETGIKLNKIFNNRPWTRVVEWGTPFNLLCKYMEKNEKESNVFQQTTRSIALSAPNQLSFNV